MESKTHIIDSLSGDMESKTHIMDSRKSDLTL